MIKNFELFKENQNQKNIDNILDKIIDQGIDSLTPTELAILNSGGETPKENTSKKYEDDDYGFELNVNKVINFSDEFKQLKGIFTYKKIEEPIEIFFREDGFYEVKSDSLYDMIPKHLLYELDGFLTNVVFDFIDIN